LPARPLRSSARQGLAQGAPGCGPACCLSAIRPHDLGRHLAIAVTPLSRINGFRTHLLHYLVFVRMSSPTSPTLPTSCTAAGEAPSRLLSRKFLGLLMAMQHPRRRIKRSKIGSLVNHGTQPITAGPSEARYRGAELTRHAHRWPPRARLGRRPANQARQAP
jgi:hypothetical protein